MRGPASSCWEPSPQAPQWGKGHPPPPPLAPRRQGLGVSSALASRKFSGARTTQGQRGPSWTRWEPRPPSAAAPGGRAATHQTAAPGALALRPGSGPRGALGDAGGGGRTPAFSAPSWPGHSAGHPQCAPKATRTGLEASWPRVAHLARRQLARTVLFYSSSPGRWFPGVLQAANLWSAECSTGAGIQRRRSCSEGLALWNVEETST